MVVVLTERGPVLEAPEDCQRFHIERRGSSDLGTAGQLTADRTHGLVDVAWIREQAGGRVRSDWNDAFDAMLAYASSKGWLVGEAIRAHIEP